jgi:hypothetical protein
VWWWGKISKPLNTNRLLDQLFGLYRKKRESNLKVSEQKLLKTNGVKMSVFRLPQKLLKTNIDIIFLKVC